MLLYSTQKGRGEFSAPTDIWLRKRRSESLVFPAEYRWQYSGRHCQIGIQDRNAAPCRLDLYYVKLVRAILRRVRLELTYHRHPVPFPSALFLDAADSPPKLSFSAPWLN